MSDPFSSAVPDSPRMAIRRSFVSKFDSIKQLPSASSNKGGASKKKVRPPQFLFLSSPSVSLPSFPWSLVLSPSRKLFSSNTLTRCKK